MGRPRGSITVSGDLHFGGYVEYTYTWSAGEVEPWAFLEVTAVEGTNANVAIGEPIQRSYSKLTQDATDPLGPTPTWQGGPGAGRVELGYWTKGTRWTPVAVARFDIA